MYRNFYASTDIQVYITSPDFSSIVKLDTAMSIGYSLKQTSTPIYSLGSRKAQFFSQGNTLGQGSFTIAFTDEEYLKYCLEEIDNSTQLDYYQDTLDTGSNNATINVSNTTTNKSTSTKKYKSNSEFLKESAFKTRNLSTSDRMLSIVAIRPVFNISIYINNETAIRSSDSKVINLIGVKIIEQIEDSSSTKDSPLMTTYNFIFQDIERG